MNTSTIFHNNNNNNNNDTINMFINSISIQVILKNTVF